MNPKFDSYSGFMDDGGAKTDLDKDAEGRGHQDPDRLRHSD